MDGTKMEGKARVDRLLLEPFAGLKRRRGMTGEAHEAMLVGLRRDLAYLDDDQLHGLRELVTHYAVTSKGVWPAESYIRTSAHALKKPEPRQARYPASLLTSEMGDRAVSEGWAIELYNVAKKYGPPSPSAYWQKTIKDDAERNAWRVKLIREHEAAGRATQAELAWLVERDSDLAEIAGLRAEKGKGMA